MSILTDTYDFDLTLTNLWEVKVIWYKYDECIDFEKKLINKLNNEDEWIFRFEEQIWSHPELIETIKSLLPQQASSLSDIESSESIYIDKGEFIVTLNNASGVIVKIKFNKKEIPTISNENKLRTSK